MRYVFAIFLIGVVGIGHDFHCQIKTAKPVSTKKINDKRPNFDGEWLLDQSKMPKPSQIGVAIWSTIKTYSQVLYIQHTESKIVFRETERISFVDSLKRDDQTKVNERTHFTDDRGELKEVGLAERTRTKWIGNKVVVTQYSYGPFVKKVEPVSYCEYYLIDNGKVLVKHMRMITNTKYEKELRDMDALEAYWYYIRNEKNQ